MVNFIWRGLIEFEARNVYWTGDICFKGRRRFPKSRSPNLAQSGFAKTEDVACSKRSDSGERCEVKKAMKRRRGLGREVRERSPLPLPRFYFFALLFTSHRSPLSERLEQATGDEAKNSFVWGKGGESNIFKKDNSDLLKSFTDRFKNALGLKAEEIIAEDNKSTREERQRLRETEKTITREGKNCTDRQRANDEVQKLRNKIEQT